MRLQLLAILLLGLPAIAQGVTDGTGSSDTPEADAAAGAPDDGAATETWSAPGVLETGTWNLTYFIAPTRNHYWVNDETNGAKWSPMNTPLNLMLSNSNKAVLSGMTMLAGNIPPGTSTWSGKISVANPAGNYLLVLSAGGNPDHKLAQSQGFWIKPNGTAQAQQINPDSGSVGTAAPGATPGAPSSPGTPPANGGTSNTGGAGGTNGGAVADTPNATPPSSASSLNAALSGVIALAAAAALF